MRVADENVFVRDESKLRTAPAWVIFTMPLVALVMVIGGIMLIVSLIRGGFSVVGCVLLCLGIVWSVFSEYFFNFYEGLKISFKPQNFIIEYGLNSSVVASSSKKVSITVSKVKKVKLKGRKVVVYGDIFKKSPFKKDERLSKVEIPTDFQDKKDVIITKIKDYIGG